MVYYLPVGIEGTTDDSSFLITPVLVITHSHGVFCVSCILYHHLPTYHLIAAPAGHLHLTEEHF